MNRQHIKPISPIDRTVPGGNETLHREIMADILESLPLIAAMRLMPAQVMSHAQAEQSIFPEVAIAMNLSARARMLIGQMSNGAMLKRKNLKRE
ncbi:hypothetical protein [Comamonas testosteroni]|uniref:hypothetical protein n=1 Tax=Comamonas testosteroni TaxID=285 RepID=UPI002DB6BC6D|nr:hypothetical protein [Comamonas testosteroni]MEB5966818.1 hypothetical protein [Comamonas testosteroni]